MFRPGDTVVALDTFGPLVHGEQYEVAACAEDGTVSLRAPGEQVGYFSAPAHLLALAIEDGPEYPASLEDAVGNYEAAALLAEPTAHDWQQAANFLNSTKGAEFTTAVRGDFAVAVVTLPDGRRGLGFAKRNSSDAYVESFGRLLALGRAFKDAESTQ